MQRQLRYKTSKGTRFQNRLAACPGTFVEGILNDV